MLDFLTWTFFNNVELAMLNGLSHVRKFIRLLSIEQIQSVADDLAQQLVVAEQRSNEPAFMNNEALTKLHDEKLQYIRVMNDLLAKILLEKLT